MIIPLTVGLMKKILLYKMSYFPEPYTCSKNKLKIELDLSNYATKLDLKNATSIDTSVFIGNIDLASLKSYIVKLDIDKLETIPADLSKLSNAVEKKVLKNCVWWIG